MPVRLPLNWSSSPFSVFVFFFLPVPVVILTVVGLKDVTMVTGGKGLLSWTTSVADVAAPRVAPEPGEDSESGIVTSASPACPSFWMGTVTVALEAFAAKVTVFWNAVTSCPPALDTTTVTAAERSPVRLKTTWAEPAVTFALNCAPANASVASGKTVLLSWMTRRGRRGRA